jgi:hypothetical protein
VPVWIQNHPYESVALLVAILSLIVGWIQYRKKEPGVTHIEDRSRTNSTVASGSGNMPIAIHSQGDVVFNHPPSNIPPLPGLVQPERPVPNLVYAGSEQRRVYLGRWDFQGIADPDTEEERKDAVPALLLRFENRVLSDRKIARASSVIAKMRFLRPHGNSMSERAVDYGVWLNASFNSTGMDAGDTCELVLMCFMEDKLFSFRDKRNGNRKFGSEDFSYLTEVDVSNFDRVEVTIIDQNSQSHLTATYKYWYKDQTYYISAV